MVKQYKDVQLSELPELISPNTLKEYLGCNNNKLYSILAMRDFPSIRIGKRYYILKKEFEMWLLKQSKKDKSY